MPPGMDDDEYAGYKSVDTSLCEDGSQAIKVLLVGVLVNLLVCSFVDLLVC